MTKEKFGRPTYIVVIVLLLVVVVVVAAVSDVTLNSIKFYSTFSGVSGILLAA